MLLLLPCLRLSAILYAPFFVMLCLKFCVLMYLFRIFNRKLSSFLQYRSCFWKGNLRTPARRILEKEASRRGIHKGDRPKTKLTNHSSRFIFSWTYRRCLKYLYMFAAADVIPTTTNSSQVYAKNAPRKKSMISYQELVTYIICNLFSFFLISKCQIMI